MKILLTGGTGFVGKNVANFLTNNNYEVISLGASNYDLRDPYACKKMLEYYGPQVIVHTAGSVGGIAANQANPGKFMYDNLAMGINMLEQTRQYIDRHDKNRSTKFIMLGTVCSYPKYTTVPFIEDDLWNGYPEETNAPYGIAKKTLVELGKTYNAQYHMNIINLIPVNMYGPHDHFNETTSHVVPALILKFYIAKIRQEKSVTIWGNGEASREFLYVDDCARAIRLAIKNDVGPNPINIGTGQEIKIANLANMIRNKIGYEGDILYDKNKPNGQPRRCLETSRAADLLGFEAQTDLDQGLDLTIDYFIKGNK